MIKGAATEVLRNSGHPHLCACLTLADDVCGRGCVFRNDVAGGAHFQAGFWVAWPGATGCQFERSSSANLLGRRARGYYRTGAVGGEKRLYSLCQPNARCQGSPVARGPGSTGQREGARASGIGALIAAVIQGLRGAVVQVGVKAGPRRRGASPEGHSGG